jgi:hypothetical protein
VRPVRLLLTVLLATCAACDTVVPPTAGCGNTPEDEGLAAFREETAARSGAQDLRLRFVLNTTVDERFTATPDIQTNLGDVLDSRAAGGTLDVDILLAGNLPVNGEIKLTGSLSGTFVEGLDRCPYTRRFAVTQSDTVSPVTVLGL